MRQHERYVTIYTASNVAEGLQEVRVALVYTDVDEEIASGDCKDPMAPMAQEQGSFFFCSRMQGNESQGKTIDFIKMPKVDKLLQASGSFPCDMYDGKARVDRCVKLREKKSIAHCGMTIYKNRCSLPGNVTSLDWT